MARAARLKVYVTRLGFFDAVVAAPSQKAALEAWDVRQNLFAEGAAKVVDDPKLAEEALAHPGEVLRKPISDADGYVAAAKRPAPSKGKSSPGAKPPKAADKPEPPDHSALDAAERALEDAERETEAELARLTKARRAAEAAEADARTEAEARLKRLRTARDKARKAFRAAGG